MAASTTAEIMEMIGLAELPEIGSWLDDRAMKIAKTAYPDLEEEFARENPWVYLVAVHLLEGQLISIVDTDLATDIVSAQTLMDSEDKDLTAFTALAVPFIHQYLGVDDTEGYYPIEAFSDPEKILVEIVEWANLAQTFLNIEASVDADLIHSSSDDLKVQAHAAVFLILTVLSEGNFVGTKVSVPLQGAEYLVSTLGSLIVVVGACFDPDSWNDNLGLHLTLEDLTGRLIALDEALGEADAQV